MNVERLPKAMTAIFNGEHASALMIATIVLLACAARAYGQASLDQQNTNNAFAMASVGDSADLGATRGQSTATSTTTATA